MHQTPGLKRKKLLTLGRIWGICLISGGMIFSFSGISFASAQEAREMISRLSASVNSKELASIYAAIESIPEKETKESLRNELHAKLDEMFSKTNKAEVETVQDSDGSDSNKGSSSFEAIIEKTKIEKLKIEIQALPMGSEPTVEILQTRNAIFSEINTVSNPDIRNELLKSLEEKENNAAMQNSPVH